jgi:carboxypeptidase Taq
MAALDALRTRLAELADLDALGRLAEWDQQVMMPPAGGPSRGEQLATLSRFAHAHAVADEIGAYLDELEGDPASLSELDQDIVRLARRDWDRQRRIPGELVGELAQAAADGHAAWQARLRSVL